MGKKQNQDKFGKIDIWLEKQNYSGGQQVNGIIYLNLYSDFPASHIKFKIEGKEKVKWYESHERKKEFTENDSMEEYTEEFKKCHRCYNHIFNLSDFSKQQMVPAGHYEFPFTFYLTQNIPSSFHYGWKEHGESCYAKIRYWCKVKLENDFDENLLKGKQNFIINEGYSAKMDQNNKMKTDVLETNIVGCCCFQQGKLKLKSYFQKDYYIPGDVASIIAEVDNSDCKVNVKSVQGTFIQKLDLRIGNNTKNITTYLSTVYGEKVEAGKKKVGQDSIRLLVPLNSDTDGVLNTSTNGKLIDCDYQIQCMCVMETCICGEHPNSKLDLVIFNPNVDTLPWEKPHQWNPRKYECYVAVLNDNYIDNYYF